MSYGRLRIYSAAAGVVLGLMSASQAQFIGTNFAGTNGGSSGFSPYSPPDTHGAIGPAHFVEFINGAYAVYNKAGTTIGSKTDEDAFWVSGFSNAGTPYDPTEDNMSDPRVFYDQLSRRWFAVEIDGLTNGANEILLARSNSNDPTGPWK